MDAIQREAAVRRRLRQFTLLAFCFSLLVGIGVVAALQVHDRHSSRKEAEISASRHARKIQDRLQQALSATFALASVLRQGNGEIGDFERLAGQMLPLYPGVSNLQLAPGGIIRQIHPLRGNEKAIGHDILNDPKRNREAILAQATRQLALAGPFDLVQGGVAVIGRFPVYLGTTSEKDRFWGFTNALILMPDLLAAAQLSDLLQDGYRFALWRIHPDSHERHVFARSDNRPLQDPAEFGFDVPNGRWTLSIEPKDGWPYWQDLAIQLGLALLFATASAGLYLGVSRYALALRLDAWRKADELTAANAQLADEARRRAAAQVELEATQREWINAFDAISSPVFLHDPDFRVMRANQAYLAKAGMTATEAIGRPYWEVFPRRDSPLPQCQRLVTHGGSNAAEDEIRLPDGGIYLSHGFCVGSDANRYYIHLLEDITAQRAALDRMRHLAHHDALTELPNRVLFEDRCTQALHAARRTDGMLALLMLDLDRFKPINDTHGHGIGDQVLRQIAHRFESVLHRGTDTLARFGGDEFVVLLSGIAGRDAAAAIAERLCAAAAQPLAVAGLALDVGVSIGIATMPDDGNTFQQLINAADAALYSAKSTGRGTYRFASKDTP